MPQSATPNMLLVEPTEGGDEDLWDTLFTTLFARIDLHDHTTGLGVKIPSAGINPNADLMFASGGTNYAITDLLAIDLAPVAATAVTSYASAFFCNASDSNNLYWRSQSGTNVKITDGSTLNVSIVGGIGGDYSSVGALVDYDDATDTYRFRQETAVSVKQFAKAAFSDIKLYEYLAAGNTPVPSNVITIKSPAALAASYSFTLPSAVPASQQILQMTAAGILTPSNTIPQDVTMAVDKSITLSGLGRVIGGIRGKIQPVVAQTANVASGSVSTTTGTAGALQAISSTVYYPLVFGLDNGQTGSGASGGDRLESLIVYVSASGGSPTYTLMTASNGDGSFSTASSGSTSASSSIGLTVSAPAVTSNTYWLKVVTDGSTTVRIVALEPRVTRT